jgi:hypothetical protein
MNIYQKQFQLQQEQEALGIQPAAKAGDPQAPKQIDYLVDIALAGEETLFDEDIDQALAFKGGLISKFKDITDPSTK